MAAAILIPCYGAMPSDASAPADETPVSRLLSAKGPGRSPREQALEVLSYVVSFSAFYLFVLLAMRLTRLAAIPARGQRLLTPRLCVRCRRREQ